jgi:NAD dependent epimerase/dehydratase family
VLWPSASITSSWGPPVAPGSAVVGELAARGLPVRAVTRSGTGDAPEGVEQLAADVGTTEGARRACEGAAVVYHCAQPGYTKWPELFPPLTRAVLDGAAAAGAKLVFADNMYVYGPPDGAMTEQTPQRAQGKKGRVRIEMADAVLGAHAQGRLRCTIARSPDYYGPRGITSTVGDHIMKPALRGKRARWLGSLDQPHTLNYLEDIARALVTLGERDEADGEVWHLPAAEPLTGRQFLGLNSPAILIIGRDATPSFGGCPAASNTSIEIHARCSGIHTGDVRIVAVHDEHLRTMPGGPQSAEHLRMDQRVVQHREPRWSAGAPAREPAGLQGTRRATVCSIETQMVGRVGARPDQSTLRGPGPRATGRRDLHVPANPVASRRGAGR